MTSESRKNEGKNERRRRVKLRQETAENKEEKFSSHEATCV